MGGFIPPKMLILLEEVSTMDELLTIIRRAKDNLMFVEQYLNRRGDPHAEEEEA